MFRRVHDLKNQLEPSNYFSSLDGYRLEESHEVGSQQYKIVCSFNLVRCLLDGRPTNTQYGFDYLETALQRLKQVTPKQQLSLNSFLKINFYNLTKSLQEQLRLDKLTHLVGSNFSTPTWHTTILFT